MKVIISNRLRILIKMYLKYTNITEHTTFIPSNMSNPLRNSGINAH